MYPFLPFINYGIQNLNKKTFRNIILFLLFFCSIMDIIGTIVIGKSNNNFLIYGYSSMWLTILYIIGGYFGKYTLANKESKTNLVYYIFLILIYLSSSLFSFFFFLMLKMKSTKKLFISYLSPTMLFQSISLVLLFFRLKIKNHIFIKLISFFAPLTFNVTLIHQRLFKENFIFKKKFFKIIKELLPQYLFFKIYGFAIIIYFLCSFIDYIRYLLFKILKIKELSLIIEKEIPKLINKIN